MPRKPKPEKPSAEILAPIPADILDQIVRDGPLTAADVETATRRFKKALIERALGAELSHHLGYAPGRASRSSPPIIATGPAVRRCSPTTAPCRSTCRATARAPLSRSSLGKHERRFTGFENKVIALYARGLTVREIQHSSERCMRSTSRRI